MRKEIALTASIFTIATGVGVALHNQESHCEGKVRFSTRGEVVICETPEGIQIQGKNTPAWIIPVESVYQAWGNWKDDTKAGYYTEDGCYITYHKLDLLTGEETSSTYCVPSAGW